MSAQAREASNRANSGPSSSGLPTRTVRQDSPYVRIPLIATCVVFLTIMVVFPVINVFVQAFSMGVRTAIAAISQPECIAAVRLTLKVTILAVSINSIFGVALAWAVARFQFPGKALLTALIDLPFSVSPVIAGLVFILLFGAHGYFGPWLEERGIQIAFAVPGIVLTTCFVTVPFVARELIPVMESVGSEEEQAALTLGARAWQMFVHVTIPNIKWGLLYGMVLCSARAIGEYGAVSVISGRLGGKTDTLPIHIEKLYQSFSPDSSASAFSVASLLVLLALATLGAKSWLESRSGT